MSNEVIVYTNVDGSCAIVYPAPNSGLSLEAVMAKDVPKSAINPRITTQDKLPQDRLFRNAWDDSNPEDFVGINLDKAKAISHDVRRADRAKKMEPLDRESGYVSTTPARQSAILTEKQAILDANAELQSSIESASSVTTLDAVIRPVAQALAQS